MKQNNKILTTIGLAMKAGYVVSGEFMTEKAIRDGEAYLVIVAGDASANTKKKFKNSCDFYKVSYLELADKDMLGNAIGKEYRASIAITNKGFAVSISKKLNAGGK